MSKRRNSIGTALYAFSVFTLIWGIPVFGLGGFFALSGDTMGARLMILGFAAIAMSIAGLVASNIMALLAEIAEHTERTAPGRLARYNQEAKRWELVKM